MYLGVVVDVAEDGFQVLQDVCQVFVDCLLLGAVGAPREVQGVLCVGGLAVLNVTWIDDFAFPLYLVTYYKRFFGVRGGAVDRRLGVSLIIGYQ